MSDSVLRVDNQCVKLANSVEGMLTWGGSTISSMKITILTEGMLAISHLRKTSKEHYNNPSINSLKLMKFMPYNNLNIWYLNNFKANSLIPKRKKITILVLKKSHPSRTSQGSAIKQSYILIPMKMSLLGRKTQASSLAWQMSYKRNWRLNPRNYRKFRRENRIKGIWNLNQQVAPLVQLYLISQAC